MTASDIVAPDARPFDVVGLGVNALDLIAVIDGFPEPDAKHMIDEVEIQGGGMTATAMVTCARLGVRARYVGKVGSDLWSRLALRLLRQDHVDIRGVIRVKDCPGHLSIVLTDRRSGTRRALVTFNDGAFYLMGVKPGEYELTVEAQVLDALAVDVEPVRFTLAPTANGIGKSDLELRLKSRF